MSQTSRLPYVVGPWVRGCRFYGRRSELARILRDEGAPTWFAGLRRIGKTSLLRQAEALAADSGLLPLFWDLQGVDNPSELRMAFEDAVYDAEEDLRALDAAPEELVENSLVAMLETLDALARGRGLRLLLFCDEAEALLPLAAEHPGLPADLADWAEATPTTRWIFASSPSLVDARAGGDVVRLLGGQPVYLGPLSDAAASDLILQTQLPEGSRPRLDPSLAIEIARACGNHPYLMQLLARRHRGGGELSSSLAELVEGRTVGHLFSVDLQLLNATERRALEMLAQGAGQQPPESPPIPRRLEALGLVSPRGELRNGLLAAWLARSRHDGTPDGKPHSDL